MDLLIRCVVILSIVNLSYGVDCKWGPWSGWTDCTHPCGGGHHHKNRSIEIEATDGGRPCEGPKKEKKICNPLPCGGKYFWLKIDHFESSSEVCLSLSDLSVDMHRYDIIG